MIKRSLIALVVLFSLGAQAGEPPPAPFIESANQGGPSAPPADMAQIILVEPINRIQGMFPNGIFELTGDQRKLVAVSSWRSKTVLLLPPGKHLLFATIAAPIGHAMEANVEAGKRYYVLLRFIYANGMQLRPLRTGGTSEYRIDGKDFPKWMKASRWIEMSPDAEAYFSKLDEHVTKGQQKAVEDWQAKTPAEVAELTLNPEDAVAH